MTYLSDFLGGRSMAEFYDDFWVPCALQDFAVDIASHVSAGDSVLDLGCGTGFVTRLAAARAGNDAKIIGLDPTPFMLDATRGNAANPENIEWMEGSGEEMAFPDDSFDVVLGSQSWQYLTDREATFREMKRVLKPGGKLVGSVWSGSDRQPSLGYLEEAIGRHFGADHTPLHSLSFGGLDELEKQAEGAGFIVVRLETKEFPWRFESIRQLADCHVVGAGRTDENGQLAMGLVDLNNPENDQIADAFAADLQERLKSLETAEGVKAPYASDTLVARA